MWAIVVAVVLQRVSALRLDECNSTALGMESGAIHDSQITASSSFDKQSVGPQNSRIRTEIASGAWCPKPQIHSSSYEFLQINLVNNYIVTAVETQGRYGNGTGREFVSEYMIDYLRPGSKWIRYRNRSGHSLMTGNHETTAAVRRALDPPIVASRIRIVPHSKQMRTICLRMELYGCLHKNGLLFYSTLPAGSRVGDVDFRDNTFENSDLYTETGIRRLFLKLIDA
ncbi:Epithelial discoidin domain-containing receptor 1 [Parelaphostrongylus tenuis]|uniref:Epithelial discoidin domain-containing receptor 1 n=1 Tax=Parelaphostrongylus tenuis TaxID=148309 RepID=A0AAD5R468_PARTN|nr:Epithelial discoidin domain-containing receptor 1 [Parelaphostrongylus tenuis]